MTPSNEHVVYETGETSRVRVLDDRVSIITGDCREVLATLADGSVDCCVTSPPYFGLRDYGADDQIGLEASPDEFVAELVSVFREVRRVLRDSGTLWLNLGDSYAGSGKGGNPDPGSSKQATIAERQSTDAQGLAA